ncbi:MAG: hypothetical protein IPM96_11490 [Ignavibacteria bacterium]|nr:hypothetical protein [Ignavibacteria bacterium]
MKKKIVLLSAVLLIAIASAFAINENLFSYQEEVTEFNAQQIQCNIQYSNKAGWYATAKIGSTTYASCGPTTETGICYLTNLNEGTYTVTVTKDDCSASQNVYHPGSGTTPVNFGPVNPTLICD